MLNSIKQLDRLLRGDATRISELRQGTIDVNLKGLCLTIVILAAIYGLCMGSFAAINRQEKWHFQLVATMLKVPALFFLTLLVTFPSLYVFNALVGSQLKVISLLRLLIAALGVMLAVLCSMGTIVLFFSLSTPSYPFMLLLNIVVFAASGILGLLFLLQTLHRLSVSDQPPPMPDTVMGALDHPEDQAMSRHVRTIFRIWVIVFGLVGAQMGWVLRPFLGNPALPFSFFRPRESNFFLAVMRAISKLFGA
jgi:hypothetical protein